MIKAGALYFAIFIAFIIAVITASLILLAVNFKAGYLKEVRYVKLSNNLDSGIAYLLNEKGTGQIHRDFDLFNGQVDSVQITRRNWGVYGLGIVKSFIHNDTLGRTFFIGIDTKEDLEVLYLSDEDRPISVSGNTQIIGNAALPKSGVKKSYAEGKPYSREKLIYGDISHSNQKLKGLNSAILQQIGSVMESEIKKWPLLTVKSASVSFKDSTQVFSLLPETTIDATLTGNIILVSDSIVTISSTSALNDIQIYAHAIIIEKGFKGNCQLFARDSIVVGENVHFEYPSVVGVLSTKGATGQPKITFGKGLIFNGIVFSHETKRSPLQTMVSFEKDSRLNGEVYATGLLKIEKGLLIAGKVSCNLFIMQTPVTRYENFLIDITFNRKARSKYYLSSQLFEGASNENSVLKWLK